MLGMDCKLRNLFSPAFLQQSLIHLFLFKNSYLSLLLIPLLIDVRLPNLYEGLSVSLLK